MAQELVHPLGNPPRTHMTPDGSPLPRELGMKYTSSRECMIALAKQLRYQAMEEGLLATYPHFRRSR